MKCLNDKELEKLFAKIKDTKGCRDTLMIQLVLFTGARSVEALRVTKADIRQGGVYLHAAKGSNNRLVPVPAEFFKELLDYAKDMNDDTRLFQISTRRFRQIWEAFRLSIGDDFGLHSLRHTFGVRLYNNSQDIHAVKTALGHKNMQNTLIYLDFVEGVKKLKKVTNGMWKKKLDVG